MARRPGATQRRLVYCPPSRVPLSGIASPVAPIGSAGGGGADIRLARSRPRASRRTRFSASTALRRRRSITPASASSARAEVTPARRVLRASSMQAFTKNRSAQAADILRNCCSAATRKSRARARMASICACASPAGTDVADTIGAEGAGITEAAGDSAHSGALKLSRIQGQHLRRKSKNTGPGFIEITEASGVGELEYAILPASSRQ